MCHWVPNWSGADPLRRGTKLTQLWKRCHFTLTFSVAYVWLDTIVQNFAKASNFFKWRPKKKKVSQPITTHIIAHHLAFLQLLEPLCALAFGRRLPKIPARRNLPVPLLANKIWRRVLKIWMGVLQHPSLSVLAGKDKKQLTSLVRWPPKVAPSVVLRRSMSGLWIKSWWAALLGT